jgi:hypothetical protein
MVAVESPRGLLFGVLVKFVKYCKVCRLCVCYVCRCPHVFAMLVKVELRCS